jgi:methyl-accepting chemotaxis protein
VLAQSGQTVANDAHDQAACIQETSASLEQVSATVRVNADRATEADHLMQQAGQTVSRATHAMNELRDSIDAIRKSNDEVSGVLKSINQIAFNTNILALNAAVEAARAGEAGAGFSVVAAEVRSLAQRAASAARLSEEIIQRTISDVSKGVDLVGLACRAFSEVSENITTSSRTVAQIASGSREQAIGVNHITEAIARIGQVTQKNVKNANRTAQAASAMSQQVESTRDHLNQLVAVVGLQQNS